MAADDGGPWAAVYRLQESDYQDNEIRPRPSLS